MQVGRTDLMLDGADLSLIEDVIGELKPFRKMTEILCTNTYFSFNNYLPMKKLMESLLKRKVDLNSKVIKLFS